MLQQISIGKRLGASFAIVLLFVIIVAGAGQWALTTSVDAAVQVLTVDFGVNAAANDAHIHTLDLRRFEKDFFINLGNAEKEAEYLAKWNDTRQQVEENLAQVEKLCDSSGDTIRLVRSDLATYIAGFQNVVGRVKSGELKTAAEANQEITPVKDNIRRVEESVQKLDDESAKRVVAQKAVIESVERSARYITFVIAALALLVVLVLSVAVTRSITRPIAMVVEIADRLAGGDSDQSVEVRGDDETTQLLASRKKSIPLLLVSAMPRRRRPSISARKRRAGLAAS